MPISVIVAQRTAMGGQLLCRALTEQRRHLVVVGCTHTPKELLKRIAEHQPDVAVISSSLEGDPKGGLKVVRELRVSSPTTCPILLLDSSNPEEVIDAFSAGAKGVACQTDPFEVLCKCIRCVHAGQVWANSRELQWLIKALVCIIHERAAERGFEAFGAGCSWPWRSAGRRRRISSVADRLGARVWLIPSTLLPGSGAAPKRGSMRGRELRGYPLKAPKARAI
jgi:CheY-like chemotaxis protein